MIILSDPKAFSRSRCLSALLPAPKQKDEQRQKDFNEKIVENPRPHEIMIDLMLIWKKQDS